jgi:hypothetical protein
MKKNSINFIATIVFALILSQFLPWWSIMVAAFVSSILIPLKKVKVFIIPFLAIVVLWVIQSWILSSTNDYILAKKIALLFPLNGNAYLLMLVTGIIGGIAAGIAAVFGKQTLFLFKSNS